MKKNKYLLVILIISHLSAFSQKKNLDYFKLGENCPYDDNEKAILYYTKAIEMNNNCLECYIKRAWRKRNINAEEAVEDYKKVLNINSNCYKCYDGIAYFECFKSKNYDFARENYYKALKLLKCETKQDFIEQSAIVQSIGRTYYIELAGTGLDGNDGLIKDRQVQLAIWDSIISVNPNIYYYKIRADLRKDGFIRDYKGALEDYMFLAKNSLEKSSSILWSIAFCNSQLGNYIQSIKYYNMMIEQQKSKKDRELCGLYYYRGECKMKLEDYRGAILDYKLALIEHPKKSNGFRLLEIYNSLGKAKLLLEDFQNALIYLNKGIQFSNDGISSTRNGEDVTDEDLAFAYYLIGFAKINLNNKEGACKSWSKSGELGNEDAYVAIKENCK